MNTLKQTTCKRTGIPSPKRGSHRFFCFSPWWKSLLGRRNADPFNSKKDLYVLIKRLIHKYNWGRDKRYVNQKRTYEDYINKVSCRVRPITNDVLNQLEMEILVRLG